MCKSDADCPGAEVCYTNLTWTTSAFCDCSHYYGGEGVNCADLSIQSYINAALVGGGAVVIIIFLLITALTDVRIGYFRYGIFSRDNTTLTWAYAILGLLCLLIWCALVLASALEPSKNSVILEGQVVQKIAQYGLAERVILSLGIFFAMTAALNISLSWVDVANKTRRFREASQGFSIYKKIIRGVQAVWLLVLLIQTFLGITIAVVAAGVLLAAGCLVTYVVGRRRFVRVLQESLSSSGGRSKAGQKTEEDKRITRVLNLIKTTSSGVIFGVGLIFFTAAAMVPISLNWQEYGRPGGASVYATLLHSLLFAFLVVLGAILNYCHRMFNNAISNKKVRELRRIESSNTPSYMMTNMASSSKLPKKSTSAEESI